jgi:hypothetical protein
MRGQILEVGTTGGGVILGTDGNRYTFGRSDWRVSEEPQRGAEVDFIAGTGIATEIFPIPPRASATTTFTATTASPQAAQGSSQILGIIGILFLVLAFIVPVLPAFISLVFGLIGAGSAKRYGNETGLVLSRIAWIGSVVVLVLAVVMVALLGVFAWPFLEIMINYIQNVMMEETARQTAML